MHGKKHHHLILADLDISEDRAVNYHADKKGTATVFSAVGATLCRAIASKPINEDWCAEIVEDYESIK